MFAEDAHKRSTCDPRFPFVCTSYRVTEHWQTGVLTRWLPWLTEAQPQMFCEMSEELAELKGIKNGEKSSWRTRADSSGPSPSSPSA